jgi:DNA polymerase-3 subunit delta'
MDGARTRGQTAALAAVATMVRGPAPQAVLLVGPEGVGKTTLAMDLAAGLLCTAPIDERPCRRCRACRLVDTGNHPDLHRLVPAGPARQVVIGGPDAKFRGVRDLVAELPLMAVEGGARVAIIEGADRMNEDAQNALLKMLEEPPEGVTIVLCADQEARLLPTVRSRCFRVRLGLVGARDIEAILGDHGLADPPTAARLGRLAGGRPGIALAYARAPAAVPIHAELVRVLLDLTDARPSGRLAAARLAIPRAIALSAALGAADTSTPARSPRRRGAAQAATPAPASARPEPTGDDDPDPLAGEEAEPARKSPAERRRAVELILGLWAGVARDLVLVGTGGARSVQAGELLEELTAVSGSIAPGSAAIFLGRVARSAELVAGNVSPELVLDSLALAWPRRAAAA